ncbi:hypothetical protein INR49_006927, partial [Caranx melampygus]
MKIFKVKVSDEGKYRCHIASVQEEASVHLIVVSSPVVQLAASNRGSMVLQCESKGWYPEPELLWLDAEGKLLSAGPTQTVRGPDDLYTVSSRVTVEKRHSNNFTCRVQQKNINQTRYSDSHHRNVAETATIDRRPTTRTRDGPLDQAQSRPERARPAGQKRGMSVSQLVSECPGGVVVQQRVDHAVRCRQTQCHHHRPLQRHHDLTAPVATDGVQVQRSNQVVGQEAEQEGQRHHGNQVHRALPVATASDAGWAVAVE